MEFIESNTTGEISGLTKASLLGTRVEGNKAADVGRFSRPTSAFRIRYQAEIEVIKKNIGDLEEIRARLGLSARSMGLLLMTDPSAWSRWTKGITAPPPHVYRMLEWYLIIKDKVPWLATQFYENAGGTQTHLLAKQVRAAREEQGQKISQIQNTTLSSISDLETQLKTLGLQILELQSQTTVLKRSSQRWKILFGLALGLLALLSLSLRLT